MNRRIFAFLLCIVLCAGTTSCRRRAERIREKIRIEAVERAGLRGLTGLEVVLRVRNDTGCKLRLDEASFDFYLATNDVSR